MKTTLKIIVLTILLLQLSCTKNDTALDTLTNQIIGEWQISEALWWPNPWTTVPDGYTYTFSRDGSFTSTRFTECGNGTYNIAGDELSLIFGCADFNVWFESPNNAFVYKIEFEDLTTATLTPIIPQCIEVCVNRFTKISE
jgi:hypothetical protein